MEGLYRASIRKIGPRALTFLAPAAGLPGGIVSNCPSCPSGQTGNVRGEGEAGAPTLLVHGWYTFQTEVVAFVQQVRPKDVNTTNPVATGRVVLAFDDFSFFVDSGPVDGALVVQFCGTTLPPSCLPPNDTPEPSGIARVVRLDTVETMTETGEYADLGSPAPSPGFNCK